MSKFFKTAQRIPLIQKPEQNQTLDETMEQMMLSLQHLRPPPKSEPEYFNYSEISEDEMKKLHADPPPNISLFSTKERDGSTKYHRVNSNRPWFGKGAVVQNSDNPNNSYWDNLLTTDLQGFEPEKAKKWPDYKKALVNWNRSHQQANEEAFRQDNINKTTDWRFMNNPRNLNMLDFIFRKNNEPDIRNTRP